MRKIVALVTPGVVPGVVPGAVETVDRGGLWKATVVVCALTLFVVSRPSWLRFRYFFSFWLYRRGLNYRSRFAWTPLVICMEYRVFASRRRRFFAFARRRIENCERRRLLRMYGFGPPCYYRVEIALDPTYATVVSSRKLRRSKISYVRTGTAYKL